MWTLLLTNLFLFIAPTKANNRLVAVRYTSSIFSLKVFFILVVLCKLSGVMLLFYLFG